jgi:hypothetical protein
MVPSNSGSGRTVPNQALTCVHHAGFPMPCYLLVLFGMVAF